MDDQFNRHRKPEGQEVKVSRDSAGNRVLLNRIAIDAESSPEARESLLETAHATASFRHPQVLTIREVRLEGDALVFVQDHPQGLLLADLLQQDSPVPLSQGLSWMRQFAHALGAAQASGLTLSQICPSEFVVQDTTADDSSGGLLCLCPPVPTGWWLEVVDPIFASPEQKSGQACDIRSTMYSSGAVLGVMLTGQRPVGEAGWHNLLATAGLPQRVNKALKAVLDTEPGKRCAHPAEWIALLDEALASIPVPGEEPEEAPAPVVREAPPKRTVTPLAGRQPLAPSSLQGGAMFLSPVEGRSQRNFLPVLALAGVMVLAAGVWQLLPKKAAPLPVAPVEAPTSAPLATVASKEALSPPSEPPPPVVAAAPVTSATPPPAPEVKTPPPPSASPEPPKLEAKADTTPKPAPMPAPPVVVEAKPSTAPPPAKIETKVDAPKIPAPMPTPPIVAEVKPSPAPPPAQVEAKTDAPKAPAPMPAPPVVAEVKPSAAPPTAKIETKVDAPKIPAPMPTPPVVAEASPKPAVDKPAPSPVADTKPQPATKDELLKQAAQATGPARSELYRKVLAADASNPKALHALVEDALADPAAPRDELARRAGTLVSLNDPLGFHAQGSLALEAATDAKTPPAAIKILLDAVAKLKQSLQAGYPGSYDVLVRASISLHNAHLQNREKPKADRVSKALLEEIDHLPDSLPAADPRSLGEEVEKQLKERAAKGPPRMQDAFLKTVMQHLYAIAAKRGDDQARAWLKTHR